MGEDDVAAKMRTDGTVVEVLSDGSARLFPETPMPTIAQEEIEAAANADADARPFTPEELAKARRVLLGTLRDWEHGRSEPDQPARPYLTVIAHDPEGVHKALTSSGTL